MQLFLQSRGTVRRRVKEARDGLDAACPAAVLKAARFVPLQCGGSLGGVQVELDREGDGEELPVSYGLCHVSDKTVNQPVGMSQQQGRRAVAVSDLPEYRPRHR